MPPRKKKTENPEPSDDEKAVMEGHPGDGDDYTEGSPGGEPETEKEEPTAPDPFAEIRAQLEEVRRENQQLRQMIPPANQPQREQPQPTNEPDWNRLLFDDPEGALRLHGEMIRKQVREELQTEYQRDQGTQRFWADFFRANPDLEGDRDLVEVTLNSNLSKLANLPVSDAIHQLADLTRQRILRYSGGQTKKPGKKVVVEGAEAPSPKPPDKEQQNVTSLSDLIKARRVKRTTAA